MKPEPSLFDRRWRGRARAVVRLGAYGALFAGGALLVGELVGPAVARKVGAAGGEGFAQGMASAEALIARGRGKRFS